MKTAKKRKWIPAELLVVMLALILGAGIPAVKVHAANGTVYTCIVTPCYRHPVTGVIEDSGGEASYATGQGMAEGAVYTTGIMEVTENGEYYLTIRMSLMDYTSGHSFWVQNAEDSDWSSPAVGITGNGTDSNGTTADICMRVPSENCVVRVAMYVEPMGRDVVFYFYPSNYSAGNSTDMNSTMITAASENAAQTSGNAASASGDTVPTDNTPVGSANGGETLSREISPGAGNAQQSSMDENKTASDQKKSENGNADEAKNEEAAVLQSSIIEPASADLTADAGDNALNGTQGLSLSTAGEAGAKEETKDASENSMGQQILILVVSITIAGLILIGAAAGVVYYFRKNWYRWGGGEDDEE